MSNREQNAAVSVFMLACACLVSVGRYVQKINLSDSDCSGGRDHGEAVFVLVVNN